MTSAPWILISAQVSALVQGGLAVPKAHTGMHVHTHTQYSLSAMLLSAQTHYFKFVCIISASLSRLPAAGGHVCDISSSWG